MTAAAALEGHGQAALAGVEPGSIPRPSVDHSRVALTRRRPERACEEGPLAGADLVASVL